MDEAPEETGRRQIYKDLGVDFFGFRASPADIHCTWAIGIISIFLIIGNSDDGSQQDPHKEPGGRRLKQRPDLDEGTG